MQCPHCGSSNVNKKGTFMTNEGAMKQRYICKHCTKTFSDFMYSNQQNRFSPSTVMTGQRFVITSIQNNTEINTEFYESLLTYCKKNDAELVVIPTLHQESQYAPPMRVQWALDDSELLFDKVTLNGVINILSTIKINAAAENPLGGLDALSKGKTLIVPHNQLQMRSLPVLRGEHPVIMTTTGTISKPNYIKSKSGEKATFNHSYSAILVDFDDDIYHLRVLNADDTGGFYDIDGYYFGKEFKKLEGVEAIITGDEHVIVTSPEVSQATYYDPDDSMVNVLKPKVIVRHDVLDCFTVSHHHRKDNFLQYSKYINNLNKIEEELDLTLDYIWKTTPKLAYPPKNVIVSSNHHDHLKRWLNETDPKIEPWNAKIFHKLTYLMLEEIEKKSGIYSPDPFIIYANQKYPGLIDFVDRNVPYKIKGIELSNHGDIGANGSRGSLTQFAKYADKVVVGHSHTPGINKGAYSVGCSTPKTLEYTNGPSSWMNTHCIIYSNGKRQLINIIRGKWKK